MMLSRRGRSFVPRGRVQDRADFPLLIDLNRGDSGHRNALDRCRSLPKGLVMSENFQELAKKYHAFYEVSPYRALVEERHGSPTGARNIIEAGFDIDVYGLATKNTLELPPPDDYALGYEGLKTIADAVSHNAGECLVEVIPFASSVFSDARTQFQPEGLIRIRISHQGIDQAVGPAEQHALEEIEKELRRLGIVRR
jgi:hypothetical protein